jgi:hypothetical protein
MIGKFTTTNTTVNRDGPKGDWFHIQEDYRRSYIKAFYAVYNNYKKLVKQGLPYRKDYAANGFVAALTLLTSTAIGTSDEIFMKAHDEKGWKTTIYPFISGRRKVAIAEREVNEVIRTGYLYREPDGKGKMHPNILDFFNNAESLQYIRTATYKIPAKDFEIIRDSSDDEDPEETSLDYYAYSSKQARKELTAQVTVVDLTAIQERSLRKRKSPPPKPMKTKSPSSHGYPLPTIPTLPKPVTKKTVVKKSTIAQKRLKKATIPTEQRKKPPPELSTTPIDTTVEVVQSKTRPVAEIPEQAVQPLTTSTDATRGAEVDILATSMKDVEKSVDTPPRTPHGNNDQDISEDDTEMLEQEEHVARRTVMDTPRTPEDNDEDKTESSDRNDKSI